ncbi:hypothetical protein J1N35_040474 [Gossypium stocksii]|uniref:Reverse transcriptase n=1 Tax=Gossypium stocksii TaxID=47602 RepID=A0A9D3UDW5_9ROSI|nr:hypothetical protein J1N35_040474 [Gossypium stocksii]
MHNPHNRGNRFKFESWWLLEPTCTDIIKKLWEENSGDILDKIENFQVGLRKWGWNIKGERDRKMKNLRGRLVKLDGIDREDEVPKEIIDIKLELNWEIEKEKRLEDSEGVLKTDRVEMELIVKDYFEGLFKSKRVGNTNHLLSGVHRCVSDEMNQLLTAEYKEKEIVEALNSIGPTKASGPDGFPAIFFQKFWHIV